MTTLTLTILAISAGKILSRDALVAAIWPDRSEDQGKSSLRQALSAIRKILPSVLPDHRLESGHDGLELIGPAVGIDTRYFETLLRSQAPNDWSQAAQLYRGNLLDGVSLPSPFEDIILVQRQRLHRLALSLVERLSETSEAIAASGDVVESFAERLLAVDPAAEEAHRAIIRTMLEDGRPNAARKQLERCAEAVRRELGVDPEERTLRLIDDAALTPTPSTGPTGVDASPPAQAARSHVGRGKPTLIVLPFDDLGSAPDDVFADGVVDEVTSALSRIPDFFVIARQSAYSYRDKFVDIRQIGTELGVQYAVEGTVRRSGERVRINVQLIDTEVGAQIWSERYEGQTMDRFDLQDRIASQVAGAVSPMIRASEIELARRKPPEDLGAYELVLRALPHFWAHRAEENAKALEYLEAALVRDPTYGIALAYKAWCLAQQACYLWTTTPGTERLRALDAADQAILHVHDDASALVATGAAYSMTSVEQDRAGSLIDRSLKIDPNNAWGWMRAGYKQLYDSEDGAVACFERALSLSPIDPFTHNMYFGMGSAYARQGEYDKAVLLIEKGLLVGPGVTWAYRLLATVHAQARNMAAAREAAERFLMYYPGMTIEKMRSGIAPALEMTNPGYWEGLRRAGIPAG